MIDIDWLGGFAVGACAGFVVFTVLVLIGTWPGTGVPKRPPMLPGTYWLLPDGDKVYVIAIGRRDITYGITYADGDRKKWTAPLADFLALATPVIVPRPVSTAKAGDVPEVTP